MIEIIWDWFYFSSFEKFEENKDIASGIILFFEKLSDMDNLKEFSYYDDLIELNDFALFILS